jgi:hypothetical protein
VSGVVVEEQALAGESREVACDGGVRYAQVAADLSQSGPADGEVGDLCQ